MNETYRSIHKYLINKELNNLENAFYICLVIKTGSRTLLLPVFQPL